MFTFGMSSAQAATIIVNDASDSLHDPGCANSGTGTCTLRDAMTFGNANNGPDEIHFDIAGVGVHTITLDANLPAVAGQLTIDGYTQTGSHPNTNGPGLGDNAVLLIEINGNGKECLALSGPFNTVRGLVINRCGGIGVSAFFIGDSVVEGNFIGTDPTGQLPRPNAGGIVVSDSQFLAPPTFVIGGSTPGARNVISGNRGFGVVFDFTSLKQPKPIIRGNFIGTDATGTTAVSNGGSGIAIGGSYPVVSAGEISGNVVSGNAGRGIELQETSNADIHGNLVGTDVSGTLPLGNGSTGVWISDSAEFGTMSGHLEIDANTIAFNGSGDPIGGGIVNISELTQQYFSDPTILGNSIFDNTSDGSVADRGLGIDLQAYGPSPNDGCNDAGEGRRSQNFPVLTAALASGTTIRIQGALDSTPATSFRIEFFASPTCDPAGYGEGKNFLGFTEVATDESCNAEFDVSLPVAVPPGEYVTATATDASTSEFSPCQVATDAPVGILSIAPSSGPAIGGVSVMIHGKGFQAGASASFGGIPTGGTAFGSATQLSTAAPPLPPGTLNDVVITNPDSSSATLPKGWMADFSDVEQSYLFHGAVERIFREGITAGCGDGDYCPEDLVNRGQVSAFIARALAGGSANVPSSGTVDGHAYSCQPGGFSLFDDVSPTDAFCKHAHYLAAQHVTVGCSPTLFCPGVIVSRENMAALVAKALVAPGGGAAVPLAYTDSATGRSYDCGPGSAPSDQYFADVPSADPYCKHVHFLWAKGIVSGCGDEPPQYCTASGVDRGAMAKYLANAFVPVAGP